MDRYHLYVSMACPWAHRVLVVRALKGLEEVLPVTVVNYLMDENGWKFAETDTEDDEGIAKPEPLYQLTRIRDLYFKANPEYSGRFTVPVLWDKKKQTIINNESKELIRMLNSEFNEFAKNPDLDLNPTSTAVMIDEVAKSFYNSVNNGVYRYGYPRKSTQPVQVSLRGYFSASRYPPFDDSNSVDPVYYSQFKTNLRRIKDYLNLDNYTSDLATSKPTPNFLGRLLIVMESFPLGPEILTLTNHMIGIQNFRQTWELRWAGSRCRSSRSYSKALTGQSYVDDGAVLWLSVDYRCAAQEVSL